MCLVMKKVLLLCFVEALLCKIGFSQGIDSATYKKSLANIVSLYTRAAGEQLPLYNGPRYETYDLRIKGTPYFPSAGWEYGKVEYDGFHYTNVMMRFDEVSQQLVIQTLEQAPLIVQSLKIKSFAVSGHTFVYFFPDTLNSARPAGFYDQLYHGKTSVLLRREKFIKEKVSSEIEREFLKRYQLYLNRDNFWYPVSSSRYALRILKDRSREIQQYIRKNKINFKNDPEQALVKIATYYDSLEP